jgi:hypothetical protein
MTDVKSKLSPEPDIAPWRTAMVWILRIFLFLYLAYVLWQILTHIISIGTGIGAGGMG